MHIILSYELCRITNDKRWNLLDIVKIFAGCLYKITDWYAFWCKKEREWEWESGKSGQGIDRSDKCKLTDNNKQAENKVKKYKKVKQSAWQIKTLLLI